ncbi:MAG: hypothetical protein L6461_19650 [Anaerolineae bacterium]|nr:hypothetical protein [Anaerolineae bacterium]
MQLTSNISGYAGHKIVDDHQPTQGNHDNILHLRARKSRAKNFLAFISTHNSSIPMIYKFQQSMLAQKHLIKKWIDKTKQLLHPVLVLILLCVLAYGIMIPWLGHVYEEWHFIYYNSLDGGNGLNDIFHYDGHPQSIWFYKLAFTILGISPAAWHLFSLANKLLSVIMFWVLLNELWSEKVKQTFTVALLFGIYPFFTLQAFPIAYSEVWFSFFVLWLSFFLSIKAIRQPKYFWQWTLLAILAKTAHVFSSEYTWFLEILRPLLFFLVFSNDLAITKRVRSTILAWLPYFAFFFTSIIWRGFFYQPLRKSFRVNHSIFENPLDAVINMLRHMIPDSLLTLFSSWQLTINPNFFDFFRIENLFVSVVMMVGGGLTYLYLKTEKDVQKPVTNDKWRNQAILLGIAGIIVGLLPSYIAGYAIYLSAWPGNARLAIAAFPGAALILTAMLDSMLKTKAKFITIAIIAALMIGWQIRAANDFREIWKNEAKFFRQVTWRIPNMKPGTTVAYLSSHKPIFSPDSPAQIAAGNDYTVALALNFLYEGKTSHQGKLPYWFLSDRAFSQLVEQINPEASFREQHATLFFEGNTKNVLAFENNGECIHLLRPEYAQLPKLPPIIRQAAKISDLDLIITEANTAPDEILAQILHKQPHPEWCYYYQKADLAAQIGDWKEVDRLWQEAQNNFLKPKNGQEFFPFIQSYLKLKNFSVALKLTREATRLSQGMSSILCDPWKQALASSSTEESAKAIQHLKCGP